MAPKFVKKYVDLEDAIKIAVNKYAAEVKDRTFPSSEHVYRMHPQIVNYKRKD